jgi:hypothetical protein
MLPSSVAGRFGSNTTYKKFFQLPKKINIFEKIPEYVGQESSSDEGRATPRIGSTDSARDKFFKMNSIDPPRKEIDYLYRRVNRGYVMGDITRFLFKSDKCSEKENFSLIKELEFLYYKKLINSIMQSLFSLISMMSAVTYYEMNYSKHDDIYISIPLLICSLTTFFLIMTQIFEHLIFASMKGSQKCSALSGNLKMIIFEILIFLLHPNPMTHGIKLNMRLDNHKFYYTHSLNDIFAVLCCLRVYFFLKLYLEMSDYYSPRGQRISKMNNVESDLPLSMKALLYNKPVSSYMLMFILMLFFASFSLRVFERDIIIRERESTYFYDSYWNNLWSIVVTMTTVGYGDISPKSVFGRIVGILVCIFGTCLISMLVVTITNVIKFTPIEEKVFIMLHRVELKEQKDKLATKLISRYIKNMKTLKDKKKYLGYKRKNNLYDEMVMNLHYFREKNNEFEFTFPGYSRFDNLRELLQIQIDEHINHVYDNIHNLNKQLHELLTKVN